MSFLDTKLKKIIAISIGAAVLAGLIIAGVFLFGDDDVPPQLTTPDPDNSRDEPIEDEPTEAGSLRLRHEGEGLFSCPETVEDRILVVPKADGSFEISFLVEGANKGVIDAQYIEVRENGERIIELPGERVMILPNLEALFDAPPINNPTEEPGTGTTSTGPSQPTQPNQSTSPNQPEQPQLYSNVITLSGRTATADASESAVRVEENSRGVLNIRIRRPGEYTIRGTLANGAITVGYNENYPGGAVTLILDGVDITSPEGPAIRASSAVDALTIRNASGKTNHLRDTRDPRPDADEGADGPDGGEDEVENTRNAALFSRAALTITGSGTLNLYGGYAHGVHARATSLELNNARVNVVSAHANGLRSRHAMTISGSTVNITANAKGIRAAGAQHGNIIIRRGSNITINSGTDAIHADVNINILDGNTRVTATVARGWKTGPALNGDSRVGVRASGDINVNGATIVIDAAEHGFNTSEAVNITGATVTVTANQRGIRGRHGVVLRNSTTRVEMSNIGIHGGSVAGRSRIVIEGGTTHVHWIQNAFNARLPGQAYPDPSTFTHSICPVGCH
ncbi:MAG: carbohydrate-binding domain-containing protein [Oscillospiraceae bacterium]|nr:carbohydrate-binding domain-containing protein [Oscillospiraceae bacterium]